MQTKLRNRSTELITYAFLILFMYTAAAKFLTIQKFASTLSKSPLIGDLSLPLAWIIPSAEVLISLLLIFNTTRKQGLYASLSLMVMFTTYLMYMILSGTKLPCNCGGVISSFSWQQHIWFNLTFVILALTGLRLYRK